MVTRKRKSLGWVILAIVGVFVLPFAGIVALVFGFLFYENHRRDWVPIASLDVNTWVPPGTTFLAYDPPGILRGDCRSAGRCATWRYFASPLGQEAAEADVERGLVALGYRKTEPGRKCAQSRRGSTRYQRGEISVWPVSHQSPYAPERGGGFLRGGVTILALEIDNLQVEMGC